LRPVYRVHADLSAILGENRYIGLDVPNHCG